MRSLRRLFDHGVRVGMRGNEGGSRHATAAEVCTSIEKKQGPLRLATIAPILCNCQSKSRLGGTLELH